MIKLFSYMQEKHGISRREYMQMLKEHAVFINTQEVTSMVATVNVGDNLEVHSTGKIILKEKIEELRKKEKIIVLFNKPKGYAVSKEDKHNKTIYEILPKSWQKDFYYIGRLDKESHGLLLLTNDTTLVDLYEKPENNIHKVYEVQIDKPIRSNHILQAKKGMVVDSEGNMLKNDKGEKIKEANAHGELLKAVSMIYKQVKEKHYVIITLNEGKKRHIRRMMKAMGYTVKDLKRTKVGKYQLGTIKPGKYMIQQYKEILAPRSEKYVKQHAKPRKNEGTK